MNNQEHHDETHERLARIETILAERDKALTAAFTAQQNALNLATRNLELRLEKLNELRDEVTQDRGEYVKREVYDAFKQSAEKFQNRAGGVLAAIAILEPVALWFIMKELGP